MKLNNHNFIVRLILAICNAWICNTGCGWKLVRYASESEGELQYTKGYENDGVMRSKEHDHIDTRGMINNS
jgi:hypothetical protein